MGIDDKIAEAKRNKHIETYRQAREQGDSVNRDLAIAQLATVDPKFAAALMTMTPNSKTEAAERAKKEAAQDALNKAVMLQNMRQQEYDRRQEITRQRALQERANTADAMVQAGIWSPADAAIYARTGFNPAQVSKSTGTQTADMSKATERQTQNTFNQLLGLVQPGSQAETPEYVAQLGNALDEYEAFIRKHQAEYTPEQLDRLWELHGYGNMVRETIANKVDPSRGSLVNVTVDGKESNATKYYRDLSGK